MEVISLGFSCLVSYQLKEMGLKKASYPFDWIFSNEKVVIDCLENNFKNFLNRDCFIDYPSDNTKKCLGHKLYDFKMFNHHNPRDFQEDFDYFKRCIERFKTALIDNKPKLYIQSTFKEIDINDVIELKNALSKKTSNFTFIFFRMKKLENRKIETIYKDNLIIIDLDILGEIKSGIKFSNKKDENLYRESILKYYK